MDHRIEHASVAYERAVFGGDASGLENADRDLDAVEADVSLARGRLRHAAFLREQRGGIDAASTSTAARAAAQSPTERELLERAAALYRRLGDVRGEGEALFWLGAFHQVVRGDGDTAVASLERSYALASQVDDRLTMSYALRHLGVAAHMAERLDEARSRLEQSTALRRELGFQPGVAANLVGLIYVALGQGRRDDASDLITEARAIARSNSAHAILVEVDAAEAVLAGGRPLTPPMMSAPVDARIEEDEVQ